MSRLESAREQIAKLESLLARIQRRVAEPRAPRTMVKMSEARLVPADPTPPFTPVLNHPVESELVAHAVVTAPPHVEPVLEPVLEAAAEPMLEAAPPMIEEPVESISGEFAVAEAPMELEELGPASEYDSLPVVEVQLVEHAQEPVASLTPAVEDGRPDLDIVGERAHMEHVGEELALPQEHEEHEEHEEEEREQPPESGRELVASPYESQRVAVATPSAPEELSLELHEHVEPPPESSKNLRVAPAVPETSAVVPFEERLEPELPPKLQAPMVETPDLGFDEERTMEVQLDRGVHPVEAAPEPHEVEAGPVSEPVEIDRSEHVVEPAAEPHLVDATRVVEAEPAPVVQAAAPVEIPSADVIRPQILAADVAAYLTAARAPRPETFGVLLDAALDL